MDTIELRKALYEGVVLFEFIKKDGTLRHARGTTCPELLPADDKPQGKRSAFTQYKYERQTVAFYDIDMKAWRCMRIDTIWQYKRAMKLV